MPYTQRPEGYHEKLAENRTAVFSDLYTWAMAYALYKLKAHETVASFDAHVRHMPHGGEFMPSGGQMITAEYLKDNWMKSIDLTFDRLKRFKVQDASTGEMVPLFDDPAFIDMMKNSHNEMTVDMVQEGGLVFGPWATARGPIWQTLIAEDYFLNPFNAESLFTSKAARLKIAANDKPMIEMGLRRSLAVGGLEVSRAAYVGGFDFTSNMEAWETYDIPMTGTIAHAGIMFFKDEEEAFESFFSAVPHNASALTDTYGDTLEGLRKAIRANEKVKQATGMKIVMKGARLDSGDLIYLSNECRKILDEAGLHNIKIIATSDLDEKQIMDLERNGSVDIYGVGTKLATCPNYSSIGGVYKLNTVYGDGVTAEMIELYQKARQSGDVSPQAIADFMREVIKLGEKPKPNEIQKATYPGEKIILRTLFKDAAKGWRYDGDILFPAWKKLPVKMIDNPDGPYEGVLTEDVTSVLPNNPLQQKTFKAGTHVMLPLKRYFDQGALVGTIETIHDARKRVKSELALLAAEHKSLTNPHPYGMGLEKSLYDKWQSKIAELRAPKP